MSLLGSMGEQLAEPVKCHDHIGKNQSFVPGILSLVLPSLLLQISLEKHHLGILEGYWWLVGSQPGELLVDFSCVLLPLLMNR